MKLEFCGAAREVTGSKHVLEVNGKRVLLDFGMFQGHRKDADAKNKTSWQCVEPIDAMVLSHAHIDHSGLIPLLTKGGFKGKVHCTLPTRDLCEYMLKDSGFIQEREFEYLKKQKKKVIAPLYTMEDAEKCLKMFTAYKYEEKFEVVDGVTATFHDAGHILGAAIVELNIHDKEKSQKYTLVFTGDLGRKNMPILKDPVQVEKADFLISECTYGNRLHESFFEAGEELAKVVKETAARGGKILIPAFAVERTQEIVYELHLLIEKGEIPEIPMFVDSPLAIDVTEVFKKHMGCFDKKVQQEFVQHGDNPFGFGRLKYTRSVEESKALKDIHGPAIIISASGMCEHGRILHHLKNNIEDPKNTILIVGYQAEHTLGRKIVEKEKTVKIFGDPYRLRAEVKIMNAFSGHADRSDLLDYISHIKGLRKIFLVHGEEGQGMTFRDILKEEGFHDVIMPRRGEKFEI